LIGELQWTDFKTDLFTDFRTDLEIDLLNGWVDRLADLSVRHTNKNIVRLGERFVNLHGLGGGGERGRLLN